MLRLKKNVILKDYQAKASDFAESRASSLLSMKTGVGKCHGKGTGILMYDGSVKNVENIKVGDLIMGDDSTPRTVKSLCRGRENMYRIIPKRGGESFTCNESHILSLEMTYKVHHYNKNEVVNLSIIDYLCQCKTFKHKSKLYRKPVTFRENNNLVIDPYIFGLWLGDGSIRLPALTTGDLEIAKKWCSYGRDILGLSIREEYYSDRNCVTYFYTTTRERNNKINIFGKFIKNHLVDRKKRIPKEYLVNSRKNRLKLLAGIVDSDGYVYNNGANLNIVTKLKGLAEDYAYLCRSLGFRVAVNKNIKGIKKLDFVGEYYSLGISGKLSDIPNILQRRKMKDTSNFKDPLGSGFDIESLGEGDYYGFELNGNHLYLLSDFTVTHNSIIALDISSKVLNDGRVDKVIIFVTKSSMIELSWDLEDKLEYDDGYTFKPYIIENNDDLYKFFKEEKNDIALIQYEKIHKIDLALFHKGLCKYKTCVMLDEAHKVKNPKSLLTVSFVALRKFMKYVVFLTATPLTSNLFDLFYLIQILDSRIFTNKTKFTEQFVKMRMAKNFKTGRSYPEIVKYKNLKLLREKIKNICFDYYPKQDTKYFTHKIKIDNVDDYLKAAEGLLNTKDAKIHAARLVDLQHVVDKSQSKLKLYIKLVSKLLPEGLITYCHFKETVSLLSRLFDKFKIEYRIISGQVSSNSRKEIKAWFNEDPSNKVLIITSAGSQSLNLQSVNNMIFYNIPFGWGAFSQAKGRIERLFSKHSDFNIHFILTEIEYKGKITGTVDYYKYELISSYGELTSTIFKADEVPKSKLKSFNKNLLAKFKKEMLWKEKNVTQNKRFKRLGVDYKK